MKNLYRIIAALLALLLFPCTSIAESSIDPYTQLIEDCLAEGMTIDEIAATSYPASSEVLSEYSDNYLKVLIAILQIELQNRNFSTGSVTVPVGTYIVGKDIPAGEYTVTYNGRVQSVIYIYPNESSVGGMFSEWHILNSSLMNSNTIGRLSLTDGQAVKIEYGEVVFTPYQGLGF